MRGIASAISIQKLFVSPRKEWVAKGKWMEEVLWCVCCGTLAWDSYSHGLHESMGEITQVLLAWRKFTALPQLISQKKKSGSSHFLGMTILFISLYVLEGGCSFQLVAEASRPLSEISWPIRPMVQCVVLLEPGALWGGAGDHAHHSHNPQFLKVSLKEIWKYMYFVSGLVNGNKETIIRDKIEGVSCNVMKHLWLLG